MTRDFLLARGAKVIKTDTPGGDLYRFECEVIEKTSKGQVVLVSEIGPTQDEADEAARKALVNQGWSQEDAEELIPKK